MQYDKFIWSNILSHGADDFFLFFLILASVPTHCLSSLAVIWSSYFLFSFTKTVSTTYLSLTRKWVLKGRPQFRFIFAFPGHLYLRSGTYNWTYAFLLSHFKINSYHSSKILMTRNQILIPVLSLFNWNAIMGCEKRTVGSRKPSRNIVGWKIWFNWSALETQLHLLYWKYCRRYQ